MYEFLYEMIDKLPSLPSIPNLDEIITFISEIMELVSYFLPLTDLVLIFSLWILIINFNFIWKVITKVWESIPFLG